MVLDSQTKVRVEISVDGEVDVVVVAVILATRSTATPCR